MGDRLPAIRRPGRNQCSIHGRIDFYNNRCPACYRDRLLNYPASSRASIYTPRRNSHPPSRRNSHPTPRRNRGRLQLLEIPRRPRRDVPRLLNIPRASDYTPRHRRLIPLTPRRPPNALSSNRRRNLPNSTQSSTNTYETRLRRILDPANYEPREVPLSVIKMKDNTIPFNFYNDNNDPSCNICFDDYHEDNNARLLRCGHFFHKTCIDKWFKTNNTCPVCRFNLES